MTLHHLSDQHGGRSLNSTTAKMFIYVCAAILCSGSFKDLMERFNGKLWKKRFLTSFLVLKDLELLGRRFNWFVWNLKTIVFVTFPLEYYKSLWSVKNILCKAANIVLMKIWCILFSLCYTVSCFGFLFHPNPVLNSKIGVERLIFVLHM